VRKQWHRIATRSESSIVLLALLFVFAQAPTVPRKAANQPTRGDNTVKHDSGNKQHSSDTSKPSIAESNHREGQGQSSHDAPETVIISELAGVSHKDGWDKAYVIFTGLLVAVGGVGVGYAVKTLRAIRKQASEMEGQRGVMEGQLETMTSQLAEMKAAGEMAKKQFDLTVSKEKPRLSVEVDPLVFERGDYVNARVKYRVRYSGTTPAFVTDSSACGQITEFITPDPLFTLPMKLSQTVLADAEDMAAPLFPPNLTSDDMDAISTGTKFIHFIGFIKYTDVFSENERETAFCFLWKVIALYGPDARFGAWVKCGPPEANRTT